MSNLTDSLPDDLKPFVTHTAETGWQAVNQAAFTLFELISCAAGMQGKAYGQKPTDARLFRIMSDGLGFLVLCRKCDMRATRTAAQERAEQRRAA